MPMIDMSFSRLEAYDGMILLINGKVTRPYDFGRVLSCSLFEKANP